MQNKRILVTGADGFIGSHLTDMLVESGAKVKALSYYNSFNNWGWLEDIKHSSEVEILCGDIRDPHYCMEITKNVDVIFNLAALIAIPYSYVAPNSYIETNIKGALNICQAAKTNGCEKVVQTSTSEVYGTAQYVPIDEKHPLQPQSPYSASKIGADAIAMSHYYAYSLPVTIARPFNTYGPRQSARAVIPTIISQIVAKEKVLKLGDLTPTREFNYVLDTCTGFIKIAQCGNTDGEVINIGSKTEISILDLANKIKNMMGSDIEIVQDKVRIRPSKSEVKRLCCDNTKIVNLTGFKPEYDLDRGLAITIDWFKNKKNLEKYKTGIYNV